MVFYDQYKQKATVIRRAAAQAKLLQWFRDREKTLHRPARGDQRLKTQTRLTLLCLLWGGGLVRAPDSVKWRLHPMPKTSTLRVPSYRRHKPTGQAVVTINGQDIYLGKWNTAASRAEYDRLIAEFLANGRRLQSDADGTVVEVLNAYRKFAERYYRKERGGHPRIRLHQGSSEDRPGVVRPDDRQRIRAAGIEGRPATHDRQRLEPWLHQQVDRPDSPMLQMGG